MQSPSEFGVIRTIDYFRHLFGTFLCKKINFMGVMMAITKHTPWDVLVIVISHKIELCVGSLAWVVSYNLLIFSTIMEW